MRLPKTAFQLLVMNLCAIIAAGSLIGCDSLGTSPTLTVPLEPMPTPAPRPDQDTLNVAAVIPNELLREDTWKNWQNLLAEEMDSHVVETGIWSEVGVYPDSDLARLIDRHLKDADVIWWVNADKDFKDLNTMKQQAETETTALTSFHHRIRGWITEGGVLIYSGNVHPAGFREKFFPYDIGFEFHNIQTIPGPARMTLTRAGLSALGTDTLWPKNLLKAQSTVGVGVSSIDYIATYDNLSSDWEVWAKTGGRPSIAAAKHGEGWIIIAQTSFAIHQYQPEVVRGLLRAAINRTDGKEPENPVAPPEVTPWTIEQVDAKVPQVSERPAGVTPARIKEVNRIRERADSGDISEAEAESQLEEISTDIGKNAFGWIVSNFPTYDEETKDFTRFEDYAKDMNPPKDPDNPTRFEADPVGTTIDLFLGEADTDKTIEWLGLDQD